MTKNLKIWAALGCFVAAAAGTQAAAPVTGATILQNVNVALNVYSQSTSDVANRADTSLASKVKVSTLNTKAVIQAVAPGSSAQAKLLEYTTYGTSTNILGYTYTIHTIVLSNGVPIFTNSPDYTTSVGVTSNNLDFLVGYTNSGVSGITNPFVYIPVTNSYVSNYTIVTNFSGVLVASNSVTPGGAVVPTGIVMTGTGYEVLDHGNATILTNTTLYPFLTGTTNTNSTGYATFSIGSVAAATNEFNGSMKATDGVALADADTGTTYSLGAVLINGGGTTAVRLEGFETGNITTLNLGGTTRANPPTYVDYTNITLNSFGYGYINGTATSLPGTGSTNYTVTGTPVLVKGTITTTLYQVGRVR